MTLADLELVLESHRSTEIVEIHEEERKIEFETDAGEEITLNTAGRLQGAIPVRETRLYYDDGNWTVEIV